MYAWFAMCKKIWIAWRKEYISLPQLKLKMSPTLKIDINVAVFSWIKVSIFFINILHDLLHKMLVNVKNLEGSDMLPCWQANDLDCYTSVYAGRTHETPGTETQDFSNPSRQHAFTFAGSYLLSKSHRVIQSDSVVATHKQWICLTVEDPWTNSWEQPDILKFMQANLKCCSGQQINPSSATEGWVDK